MDVSIARGFRQPGVDDDQLHAPRPRRLHRAHRIGHQEVKRCVRDQRVASEDHHHVGGIEALRAGCPEAHSLIGYHLGRLIERIGGEEVPRSQRLHERQVDREGGGVEVRPVADEQAKRLGTVPVDDLPHLLGNLIQRLLNGDACECPVGLALQRMKQTFGAILRFVTVQALETGIAAAHDVILVAANADDPILIINSQFCTAARCTCSAKGRHCSHVQTPRPFSSKRGTVIFKMTSPR